MAALALALTACGDADAEPDTASAKAGSATPSPTGPPPQPDGAHGVTYQVLNWADYHADPLVLSVKENSEAYGASVNDHKIYPEVRSLAGGEFQRFLLGNTSFAWQHDLHTDPVAQMRVISSKVKGRAGTLVVCVPPGNGSFRTTDGNFFDGKPDPGWTRLRYDLKKQQGSWTTQQVQAKGPCKGGAS